MFSLRVVTTCGELNFQYKARETAQAAYDAVVYGGWEDGTYRHIGDDYNRQAKIDGDTIAHVILSDLSQEVDCSTDLAILQAEAQVKTNNRVAANPLLRNAGPYGPNGLIGMPPRGRG